MIKESKFRQFGFPRENAINFIIIHNSGSDQSASELFNWLDNDSKDSQCCHYLVDYKEIIEVMPLDWAVFNTSNRNSDAGNRFSIVIEICSDISDEQYLKGEEKAVELIKEIMKDYNLTTKDIYFHNEFNRKIYCPSNILDKYKTKDTFIKRYFKED